MAEIKMFNCDLCEFKCKRKSYIKYHKQYIHNINVVYVYCNLCEYKCKQKNTLNQHMQSKHTQNNIKNYQCDFCKYKCKRNTHLKRHKRNVHDIGVNKCSMCLKLRHSKIYYKNAQICKICYKQVKDVRVERVLNRLKTLDKLISKINFSCEMYLK